MRLQWSQGTAIIDNGVIDTGNQRILIRCATHRGRRLSPCFTGGELRCPLSLQRGGGDDGYIFRAFSVRNIRHQSCQSDSSDNKEEVTAPKVPQL